MHRRTLIAGLVSACTAPTLAAQSAASPPSPLYFYAGMAGRLTQDRDRLGGNPFASAFVETIRQDRLTLEQFGARLAAGNARHSGGWQQIEMPRRLPDPRIRLDEAAGGRRIALVLINSDYSKSPGVYSLPGARFDSQRVTAALAATGFEAQLVLDVDRSVARAEIDAFARRSADADIALVYVGGHGVQKGRTVYAVHGDYPDPTTSRYLATHALSLEAIGGAARARRLNLVLYASCRDYPFDD